MRRFNRTRFVAGIILILLGAWLLAVQFVPGLESWVRQVQESTGWPAIIIGVGLLLLLLGLLAGAPGMALPACIVGGIGGILWWQNTTGNWASWSYLWTLIPGFVGIGIILAGILGKNFRSSLRSGGQLVLLSLILFAVFGYFFGAPEEIRRYWPVLLILLGLSMLIGYFFRGRRQEE